MPLVRGTHLKESATVEAFACFIYRYTGDHKPKWMTRNRPDGTPYPLQFVDDDEWLSNTWFHVRKDGELDKRHRDCESHPTWPNNPELRKS